MDEPNPNRHKYYDVIVAWANGEPVQHKGDYSNWKWMDYADWFKEGTPGFNNKDTEWRIKPKTKMVQKGIVIWKSGEHYGCTQGEYEEDEYIKLHPNVEFIGFVPGTEETVEVEDV